MHSCGAFFQRWNGKEILLASIPQSVSERCVAPWMGMMDCALRSNEREQTSDEKFFQRSKPSDGEELVGTTGISSVHRAHKFASSDNNCRKICSRVSVDKPEYTASDRQYPLTYLNKQGGRVWKITLLVTKFLSWCHKKGMQLRAEYLDTNSNYIADQLSRAERDTTDWRLNPHFYHDQ